jgi:hypothetical protein
MSRLALSAAATAAAFPSGVSAAVGGATSEALTAALPTAPVPVVPAAPATLRLRRRGSVMILGIGLSSRSNATFVADWNAYLSASFRHTSLTSRVTYLDPINYIPS